MSHRRRIARSADAGKERPAVPLRGVAQHGKVRLLRGGTRGAGGHRHRLRCHAPLHQQRLREVLPPQSAAGIKPVRLRAGPLPEERARRFRLLLANVREQHRISEEVHRRAGPLAEAARIGRVDAEVPDVFSARQGEGQRLLQRCDALRLHLRPAFPASVPPPVVMVQPERRVTGKGGDFPGEEHVPAHAQIVCPERRARREQSLQCSAHLLRRPLLL